MRNGLERECSRINNELATANGDRIHLEIYTAGDGENGIENQIRQMYKVIGSKPDLLIVQPTDSAALAEPLKAANKLGIPVVAYDQYISGGKLAAFRTSDNYQAGRLCGEYIAARFFDSKNIKIVLVEYPKVSSTVERVNGFFDALDEAKCRYQILKSYNAVNPEEGKEVGAMILKDFPDKNSFDVLFTINDGGGLAIVDALANAGRTEILSATIDGDPASVNNIRKGRLTVIDSAQLCGALGAETIRCAYAVLKGEKVPYHALVPVFPVTQETMDAYEGWDSIPKSFTKTWKCSDPEWQNKLKIIKE